MKKTICPIMTAGLLANEKVYSMFFKGVKIDPDRLKKKAIPCQKADCGVWDGAVERCGFGCEKAF